MKSCPYDYCRNTHKWVSAHQGIGLLRRHISVFALILTILIFLLPNSAISRPTEIVPLNNPELRRQLVEQLERKSQERKTAAWAIAQSQGWAPKGHIGDSSFELMEIEDGRVYVYKTCNVNSAISIGVDLIRNTPPYDVNAAGLTVGLWDVGAVRPTHQEFVGRVSIMDGAAVQDHSTHVGGTIGAAGVVASALGMAPKVHIDSYEWNNDVSEMTSRAMSYPNEPGKIQVSNHSYTYVAGWRNDVSPPQWYGTWGQGYRESDYFGIYNDNTASWDQLCYNFPYYLPFNGAGNDRSDTAPAEGTIFEYYAKRFGQWNWWEKAYDSSTDPYDDGWDNGGFDTIPVVGCAKNIMTVGAVNDAVTGGLRDPAKGTMTSFSCWGPTDDGRIKPDIVTNGVGIYSTFAGSDTSYGTYSGTSVATPGASGAAILLVGYYDRLFPAQAMRASTLKALIIHTADDLGNPGPDYKFGWGLLNAKAAADQIKDRYDFPDANKIVEDVLDDVNTVKTYTFKWDSTSPIKATLCWTDPPASKVTGLDNPSPRLINDLDLRIIDPNASVTYYPFVLNPASPALAATTGDNTLDNVEQVLIPSPSVPGYYTVQVSYKNTLTNGHQYYSLILSGQFKPLLGDFNKNGVLDYDDLWTLLSHWLADEPSVDIAPQGGDGIINFLDFAAFAEHWQ